MKIGAIICNVLRISFVLGDDSRFMAIRRVMICAIFPVPSMTSANQVCLKDKSLFDNLAVQEYGNEHLVYRQNTHVFRGCTMI